MSNMKKKREKSVSLTEWEQATQRLAEYFCVTYFETGAEMWWVASEVGGVLCINDHFFDINDIADFVRYGYSREEMFEYYEQRLRWQELRKEVINIKSWIKMDQPDKSY